MKWFPAKHGQVWLDCQFLKPVHSVSNQKGPLLLCFFVCFFVFCFLLIFLFVLLWVFCCCFVVVVVFVVVFVCFFCVCVFFCVFFCVCVCFFVFFFVFFWGGGYLFYKTVERKSHHIDEVGPVGPVKSI